MKAYYIRNAKGIIYEVNLTGNSAKFYCIDSTKDCPQCANSSISSFDETIDPKELTSISKSEFDSLLNCGCN